MGRKIEYTIYKNKVWADLVCDGVPINTMAVFIGNNRKECEKWLMERKQKSGRKSRKKRHNNIA